MIIHNTITIRGRIITPPLLLAPMAGVSHSALRTMLMSFGGVGMLSTEMLSARRLPSENGRVSPLLIRTGEESPLSYQLFVTGAAEVKPAIDALHRLDADAVDLNLGCPAPKVRSAGGGSRLMENPAIMREIVAAARKCTNLPLTAKIRLGQSLDDRRLRNICRLLEGEGVDLLTVHARLRSEPFGRSPRWDWVGMVKDWITIPVIANGSIFSVEDARQCLQTSGADGLMIGRAAPQKPWIFAEIARAVYGLDIEKPSINLPAIYAQFMQNLVERFGPERRLGRLKEFSHYFARNFSFGHHLASAVQSSRDFEEARHRAEEFFARYTND
jgi:tRNA-dihydrouridine synthase B